MASGLAVSIPLALAGGALIGLVAGYLWLKYGLVAGISGILRRALRGPERSWRIAFVAGTIVAGLGASLTGHSAAAAGLETTGWGRLALAGLLVGLGTSLGNGCTSGHGICGIARGSVRSLVAVPVFMACAMITVAILKVLP